MFDNSVVVANIERLRLAVDKNFTRMCHECNVNPQTLKDCYNNKRPLSKLTLDRLTRYFNVDAETILGVPEHTYPLSRRSNNGNGKGNLHRAVQQERKKRSVEIVEPRFPGMEYSERRYPVAVEHPPMPQRRRDETFEEYYQRLRSGI